MIPGGEGQRKLCVEGTHRARLPQDTWKWIEPVFAEVGITRVADVTWLDETGIPVFQAIRPDSWSLCVSQGKGITADLARVSAAMESIELWHAERLAAADLVATPREMADRLGYRIGELVLAPRSAVNMDFRLEWSKATVIRTGEPTWIPTRLLDLDCRVGNRWNVPLFTASSNGLASGNTLVEAVLHGLYEVVERDAIERSGTEEWRLLDLNTVTGPGASLLESMWRVGVDVRVRVLSSPVGLPCFWAYMWSDTLSRVFSGYGCHVDRDVALCRALTEAAQSRVAAISGTRDDLLGSLYEQAEKGIARSGFDELFDGAASVPYAGVPTFSNPDLVDDLRMTADLVAAANGREPIYLDHTRPALGIPVVSVIWPGAGFQPDHY